MNTFPNKLEVENLFKNYGNDLILRDISFHVKENEFVSIIGPSGCGKSTLFNVIAGLEFPLSGAISLDGQSILGVTGKVGYMHQKDLLLPWRTVLTNVALPLEIQGVDKKTARENIIKMLPVFGLEGHENKYPAQLSGGMRQRTSLMRASMLPNDIMLLDEPFGSLDAITKSKMQDYLFYVLGHMKKTILFITHDIDEAVFLSDRVIVLGGTPTEIVDIEEIKLERPRSREVVLSSEFLVVKKKLIELL
jgi:ABC-type nitrate/sulfonate/bicarbonate transport system ATPase subunit